MNILYEDNHLIAVEKDTGVLTQQDFSGENSLLDVVRDYIKNKYNKPGKVYCAMLHRLDKPVSGIVLFAKTSKAASRLNEQFRNGTVQKYYLAVTAAPKTTHDKKWVLLRQYLSRRRGYSLVHDHQTGNATEASLRYRIIDTKGPSSRVLVHLLTGKKHQIRAQLASRGMPIVGDATYHSPAQLPDGSIMLHACALSFMHPTTGENILIISPPPQRFQEYSGTDLFTEEFIRSIITG
ncbi:MAG TPA: RluA family pseudouridine synthase [Spirochaetota bacterium]|nr:RluA family pseudouridine synthase [Spirochaetota bacterium]HPI88851.1 RluA family pseudouridine synthase [Spirochaetota bacterium]HPR47661.1 RluA family pseudouridine synthase [Spirochaetota bacterium]